MTGNANGLDLKICFDAGLIAQSFDINEQTKLNEEQDQDEAKEEEEVDEFDADEDLEPQPYNFTLEVTRQSGPEKTLKFEVEVLSGIDDTAEDIYITAVHVLPKDSKVESPYLGPDYYSLDETLREGFDAFVKKNFKKLVPFIAAYSRAKESKEYAGWLNDVKQIVSSQ